MSFIIQKGTLAEFFLLDFGHALHAAAYLSVAAQACMKLFIRINDVMVGMSTLGLDPI